MDSFAAGATIFVALLLLSKAAHIYYENKIEATQNNVDYQAEDPSAPAHEEANKSLELIRLARSNPPPSQPEPLSDRLVICSLIAAASSSFSAFVARSPAPSDAPNVTESFRSRKINLSNRLEGYLNRD